MKNRAEGEAKKQSPRFPSPLPDRRHLSLFRSTSPPAIPFPSSHRAAPAAAGSIASPTHPSLSGPISTSLHAPPRHLRQLIQAASGESHHHEAQPEVPIETRHRPMRLDPVLMDTSPWPGFRASAPAPVARSSSSSTPLFQGAGRNRLHVTSIMTLLTVMSMDGMCLRVDEHALRREVEKEYITKRTQWYGSGGGGRGQRGTVLESTRLVAEHGKK
uniref:Uncharacterized protein n=1 Tax=Triticum urartu TaxID=4572 RepID=A0A8R7UU30_TRIUA